MKFLGNKIIYLLGFIFLCISAIGNTKQVNYGGSNHWLYSAGTADGFNTNDIWYVPALNIRPVVGLYHLNSSLVQQQMFAARASGQKAFILPIATASIADCENNACNDGVVDGVWGEVINYETDGLIQQHQKNIKDIISYANHLGFSRLIVRFNHYDSPWYWTSWNEPKYQKIWNYIWSTHNTISSYRQTIGSNMEILYDLGAELGGVSNGQGQQFTTRLWSDYTYVFTNADTIGFSFAYAPGRFTAQKKWYGHTLPKWWAFDIYPGSSAANSASMMTAELNSIMQEMGVLRNQPIMILETWFNDISVKSGIQNAINSNRLLNIDMISQWPTTYNSGHFSPEIIRSLANQNAIFGNYTALLGGRVFEYSSSNADVMAVADNNCSTSAKLPCAVTLVLGTPPSGKQNVVYVTSSSGITTLVACQHAGDLSIPWIGESSSYTFYNYQIESCTAIPPKWINPNGVSTINF